MQLVFRNQDVIVMSSLRRERYWMNSGVSTEYVMGQSNFWVGGVPMERPASKMTQQKAHRTIRQDHEDHATKYGKDFAIKDCRRGDIRSDPAGEKLHCTPFISTHCSWKNVGSKVFKSMAGEWCIVRKPK